MLVFLSHNARTVVDDVCVWLPVHHLGPVHDAGRGAVARGVGVGEGVADAPDGAGVDLQLEERTHFLV